MRYFKLLKNYYSKKEIMSRIYYNLVLMHPVTYLLRVAIGVYLFVWCLVNQEAGWEWMFIYVSCLLIWMALKPAIQRFWLRVKPLGCIYKFIVYKIGMGQEWFLGYDEETGKPVSTFKNKFQWTLFTYVFPKIAVALYFGVWILLLLCKTVDGGYVSYDSTYEVGEQVVIRSSDIGEEIGIIESKIPDVFDGYNVVLENGQTVQTSAFHRIPNEFFALPEYSIRGKVVEGSYGVGPYFQNIIGFCKHISSLLGSEMDYAMHYHNDGTPKDNLFSFMSSSRLTLKAW